MAALRMNATWNRLPRVEPSEEIRRVVERWTKSIAEGDAEPFSHDYRSIPAR